MTQNKRPLGKRNTPQGRAVPFGEGVGFPNEPSPRHRLEHQRNTINTIPLKKAFRARNQMQRPRWKAEEDWGK
jgi:hypothetical protein